jgi:uncharacterized protein YeaO (DUF488 family)
MDIRRYDRIRKRLAIVEDRFIPTQKIEERWKKLIGPGCGYFCGWRMSNKSDENADMVVITYISPRGNDQDTEDIPVRFFEIEPQQEAVTQFIIYMKEKRALEKKKEDELREAKDRKLLEELTQKYGQR